MTKVKQRSRKAHPPAVPADALEVEDFIRATGEPRDYFVAYVQRGLLDDAFVPGDRGRGVPPKIRSVGLAMFLLIDEIAILMARGTLTAEQAVEVRRQIGPELEWLWSEILNGAPVRDIWFTKAEDPNSRIEMSFLKRAAAQYAEVATPTK
jgi:hypothetical protein